MEWALLALFAAAAAALIALPRLPWSRRPDAPADLESLRAEHRLLLAELRELDEDAGGGRIAAADRLEGRRALAPRLRAVTERLRNAAAPGVESGAP